MHTYKVYFQDSKEHFEILENEKVIYEYVNDFGWPIHEQGNSVIRIKTSDKTKVDEIINSYKNNNSIKI